MSEDSRTQQQVPEKQKAPVRIVLPFKDQKSANALRIQLGDLGRKINEDTSPVYTSRKITNENNQSKERQATPCESTVRCLFIQCSLCDAGYVGNTCRYLHQRIEELKGLANGNHLKEQHNIAPNGIARSFKMLRKCQNNLTASFSKCFFFNKELKPTGNKQCDSIRAKLFV